MADDQALIERAAEAMLIALMTVKDERGLYVAPTREQEERVLSVARDMLALKWELFRG